MTKQEQIEVALQRLAIGDNPTHPDWYDGMSGDAQEELDRARELPDEGQVPIHND